MESAVNAMTSDGLNRYDHLTALTTNASISRDWVQFPGIPVSLPFEGEFARDYHREWMYNNWHVSIPISFAYIILTIMGKRYMSNRKAYELRTAMVIWSSLLAIFSIIGTIRCLPEFIHVLYTDGLFASYCKSSYFSDVRLTFWYWIFVWSKVAELGDTVFIVLRKSPLIALHWIHHMSTLTYAFYVIGDIPGTARWMVNMNFAIHSLMYSYYALKAMRVRVSRSVAMIITVSQIVQMVFGLYINFYAFWFKTGVNNVACDLSVGTAAAGLIIYSLFFGLFINFFFVSYIKPYIKYFNVTSKKNE